MFQLVRRSRRPFFFWGMISGLAAGMFMMRWLMLNNKSMAHQEKEHREDKQNNKSIIPNIKQNDMQELFNTFMNGTEQELENAAKDLD